MIIIEASKCVLSGVFAVPLIPFCAQYHEVISVDAVIQKHTLVYDIS